MAKDALRFLHLSDGDLVKLSTYANILDKNSGVNTYISYMLSRTNQMFTYTGLPDTIPQQLLELMLQSYGSVGIVSINSALYAFRGDAGGAPDPYYRPTLFTSANPALTPSPFQFRIVNHFPPYDKQQWSSLPPAVYFRNDVHSNGLLPLFARYSAQMVENDISIRSAQINSRQQTFITASTAAEIESADKYLRSLEAGELTTVAAAPFLEGLSATNVSTMASNAVIQLIELQQYLKASWYNELGLNSSFNMKREYLSAEEIKASTDVLLPLVDDMFLCRQIAVEEVNKEFGTTITVSKNSAWQNKQEESENRNDKQDNPDSTPDSDSTSDSPSSSPEGGSSDA